MTNAVTKLDYLRVDAFLASALEAKALTAAFETKLIDFLIDRPGTLQDICIFLNQSPEGVSRQLSVLTTNKVVQERKNQFYVTEDFQSCAPYFDLIKAKIYLCELSYQDMTQHYHAWIAGHLAEIEGSEVFQLFDYGRAKTISLENIQHTKKWVDVTTQLTRHEAKAFTTHSLVPKVDTHMDIGGNSGEFAYQAMAAGHSQQAHVIDLPVVCEIGKQHISKTPYAGHIQFTPHDMRQPGLPRAELITFKSVLHDWPTEVLPDILRNACSALSAGGQLIILERESLPKGVSLPTGFHQAFNLIFAQYYRSPDVYKTILHDIGMEVVDVESIDLDWPFALIKAIKSA